MSWTLTIHLTGGDRTYDILYNGWDFPDEVGAKGAHLTQSLKLTIKSAEAFALFLSETSRLVKAEVKHDNTVMFEGVIRPYLSVSARGNYEEPISVQVMDYTEALHIVSGEDRNDCGGYTLAQCVDYLFNLAGISTTRDYPAAFSSDTVEYLPIKSSEYYDAVLTNLLFERGGWDYKFTPGHVKFYKTEAEEQPNTTISDIRDSLNINREDYWADGISVKYMKLKSDNIVLFRQDAEIPYSDSGAVFPARTNPSATLSYPGGVTFTDARGLLYDGTYNAGEPTDEPPSGKGQVSWSPEYNEKSGSEITPVSISNVSVKCSWDKVSIKQENPVADNITVSGARLYVGFKGTFTFNEIPLTGPQWSPQWHITASGHVVYLCGDSEEYVENTSGSRPEKTTRTLKYVYDATMAQNYAKRELKRQKTAGITYTFKSLTAYEAGTFHLLNDSVTGVQTTVRVLSCRQAANGIYTIKAEGADIFSLPETVLKALYYSDMFRVAQSDFRIISDLTDLAEGQTANLQLAGAVVNAGDDVTFSWKLNGVSIGTGKTKEIAASSLSSGSNEVTCSIVYNANVIQTASITLNLDGASQVVPQYYVSTSKMLVQGGSWLNGYPYGYSGYLWRRLKIVNSNGGVTYTDPVYILKLEDVDTNLVTNEIQYGLSTSDTVYNFPSRGFGYDENSDEFEFGFEDVAEWTSDYDNWYKGLYVWQRIKTTAADGTITYSSPIYAEELTESLYASCVFELAPEHPHFIVNKASSIKSIYAVRLLVTGYSPTDLAAPISAVTVLNFDGSSTGISEIAWSGQDITFKVARNTDAEQIVITATGLYGETAECSMTADNQTVIDAFGGLFATDALAEEYFNAEYDGFMDGYTYAVNDKDNAHHLSLRTYVEGSGWVYLSSSGLSHDRISMICGKAQQSVLNMVEEGSVTASDFGYFRIIITNIVTADFIGSKVIQIQNDEDGNPGVIYGGAYDANGNLVNANGKGFYLDANGTFKVYEATITNITIDGKSKFKGEIESDVLKTKLDAATQGESFSADSSNKNPVAYLGSELASYINSNPTYSSGTRYSASGKIGAHTICGVVYYQSAPGNNTLYSNGSMGSSGGGYTFSYGGSPVARRIRVKGIAPMDYDFVYNWHRPKVSIVIGGTETTIASSGSGSEFWGQTTAIREHRTSFDQTFDVPPNTAFSVKIGGYSYSLNQIYGELYIYDNISEVCGSGLNFFKSGSMTKYTASSLLTSTYYTETPTFTANGVQPWTWTISNKNAYPGSIHPLYTFSWDSSPSSESSSSMFYSTPTYTLVDADGNTVTPAVNYLVWTASSIDANGDASALLSSTRYVRSYSVSVVLANAPKGVYLGNTFPISGAPNIGAVDKPFGVSYADQWIDTSSRDRKEDIEDYTGSALEIINDTKIVQFHYKSAEGENRFLNYGFIAEDTREELASPSHKVMVTGSCIGILMKAVQELAAELNKLKGV